MTSFSSGSVRTAEKRPFKHWAVPVLVLLGLFALAILIVDPRGDFPFNDDWSYAAAVRSLVRTGDWRPPGWVSMPLISNALWAAPFCKWTSCSFDDLRATTLLATAVFMLMTFALVRSTSGRNSYAFLSALLVALNPITLPLSFSFMTDVLFAALCAASTYAFLLCLKRDSWSILIVATLLAVAATLSRQLGLYLPLAFAVARLLRGDAWVRRLVQALTPVIVVAAALFLFNRWLAITGRTPDAYHLQSDTIKESLHAPAHLIAVVKSNIVAYFLYLGLFTAPLHIVMPRPALNAPTSGVARLPRLVGALVVAAALAAMIFAHRMMPFGINYLNAGGVGLPTLHDGYDNMRALPAAWWGFITLLSLVGAYGLAERITIFALNAGAAWRRGSISILEQRGIFLLLGIVIYLAPVTIIIPYDRYFIVVLPALMAFLAQDTAGHQESPLRRIAALSVCVVLALFSVLATHDYMSWNRARWSAIQRLESTHVADASNLDGGFEYNGMHNYAPGYKLQPGKSIWWVKDDTYMVSFGPVAGFKIIETQPYASFIPPFDRELFVLRKEGNG